MTFYKYIRYYVSETLTLINGKRNADTEIYTDYLGEPVEVASVYLELQEF